MEKNTSSSSASNPSQRRPSILDEPPLPRIAFPPQLPSPTLQHLLFDSYKRNIYPLFPVVQRDELLGELKVEGAFPLTPRDILFKSPASRPKISNGSVQRPYLLIFAVFAASAEYLPNDPALYAPYKSRSALAEAFFSEARQLTLHYMDSPRVSTVIALVLMAHYLERTRSTAEKRDTMVRVFAGMSFAMAQGNHHKC